MSDPTGSSINYKFSLELFGHTCPLSRCRNTNLDLTSSLEVATSTTSQSKKTVIKLDHKDSSQTQPYNQDEEVKHLKLCSANSK